MEVKFQSGAAGSDSYENLQFGDNRTAKNQIPPYRRKWKVCKILIYLLLFLMVILSLTLSIMNTYSQQRSRLINQQQLQELKQSIQQGIGSVYCGEDKNFKVIMDAYTTEGIVNTPNSQLLTEISSYTQCYKQCIEVYQSNCSFFSFHDEEGMCTISSADFYSTWTLTDSIDGAFSCYRYKSDQWKTMYRRPKLTKSGYTNEITGPWIDNSYYTNQSLHSTAESLPDSVSWSILKSPLNRFWESLNIDKVKVSLYKDGREVQHLIFNGRGSNLESWFNLAFLLETSWKDLSPANPPTYLGWWWKGDNANWTHRSMYVASLHQGCPSDIFWMALLQNEIDSGCPWEQIERQKIPTLLYAPTELASNQSEVAEADYMTISVKFPRSTT